MILFCEECETFRMKVIVIEQDVQRLGRGMSMRLYESWIMESGCFFVTHY